MRNEKLTEVIILVFLVLLVWFVIYKIIQFLRWMFGFVTVYSWQSGLHYRSGKLERVLGPGRYFVLKPYDTVTIMDLRESVAHIVNQEIICADNLPLRLSSSVIYKISDPVLANEQARSYAEVLYLDVQLAMREAVNGLKVEDVLQQRSEISARFLEILKPRAAAVGLTLDNGGIRDITFPGDVKKIFTQVAQAEKAAQATLAKSRAETASLRALANAARMMENNPSLLHLRTLQSVAEVANSTGNTIIFGMPPNTMPIPLGEKVPVQDLPVEDID